MRTKPLPGVRVRFSAKFCQSTGINDRRRPWTVQECDCELCRNGRHLAVDETNYDDTGTRHVAFQNLEICK